MFKLILTRAEDKDGFKFKNLMLSPRHDTPGPMGIDVIWEMACCLGDSLSREGDLYKPSYRILINHRPHHIVTYSIQKVYGLYVTM